MFKTVRVIGRGRVGSALAARLLDRGVEVTGEAADLIVLCVPDAVIPTVAASIPPGPWVAHVSGATPLSALAPHVNRFGVHPLQTFSRSGAPGQFDGSWGAIAADSDDARARAQWLAAELGLRAFEIADDARPLYHAGASIASNYLVTLHRAAALLFERAGVPPAALLPLMRRTIENGFDLTGPIARGDWATVDAHRNAIRTHEPELLPMYDALARVTVP